MQYISKSVTLVHHEYKVGKKKKVYTMIKEGVEESSIGLVLNLNFGKNLSNSLNFGFTRFPHNILCH